jgi:hypothetical protein
MNQSETSVPALKDGKLFRKVRRDKGIKRPGHFWRTVKRALKMILAAWRDR